MDERMHGNFGDNQLMEDFFELEKNQSTSIIAMAMVRSLYENKLIRKEEYEFVKAKYQV